MKTLRDRFQPEKAARQGKLVKQILTKDGGFAVYEKGIEKLGRTREWRSFADHKVEVQVESAGDLSSRVTATRLLATGVFALALKKKKDTRSAFLTVTVDGEPTWISEIAPDKAGNALVFAEKARAASQ